MAGLAQNGLGAGRWSADHDASGQRGWRADEALGELGPGPLETSHDGQPVTGQGLTTQSQQRL